MLFDFMAAAAPISFAFALRIDTRGRSERATRENNPLLRVNAVKTDDALRRGVWTATRCVRVAKAHVERKVTILPLIIDELRVDDGFEIVVELFPLLCVVSCGGDVVGASGEIGFETRDF